MLVLGRRVGEKIIIDHDIEVVVVAIHGDTVRVGVHAPKHIEIQREEIQNHKSPETLSGDAKPVLR